MIRKKTSRISAAVICAALIISSCGCASGGTSSGAGENSGTSQSAVSSAADKSDASESVSGDNESKDPAGESTGSTPADDTPSDEESGDDDPISSDGNENHVEDVLGVVTNGQLVVDLDGHTWGISLYGGGTGANYASYLNEFKELVGSSVNVYNLVVPTAGEYYLPSGYESYNASHLDSINSIANALVGVINVDGYSALKAHTSEYIYTRTDHHWQPLGAYYAAAAFCDIAQTPAKDISTYTPEVIEGFVGTMYGYTDYNEKILNDPDTFTYYIPSTDYTATYYTTDFQIDEDVKYFTTIFVGQDPSNAYGTFMGGDKKIVKIETENKNGRRLCVFKDSYGNAEIPFFIDSFEEIYVCDVRYFDLYAPDFVRDNNITDVLFTMCTFSAVGPNAEYIKTDLLNG